MTLCNITDVEALTQTEIDETDDRMIALLEMATELIEGEIGRTVQAVTLTDQAFTVERFQTALLLPHWPLASIGAITEDGEALTLGTDYSANLDAGILHRHTSGFAQYWHSGPQAIVVATYTTAVPPGLRAICAAMVARAFKSGAAFAARPTIMTGFRQLTIGRWSATAETDEGATRSNPLYFAETELAEVRGWKDRRA